MAPDTAPPSEPAPVTATAACEHGPDCLRVTCHVEDEPALPDLDARLNALLVECGRQEKAIYRGDGVPASEALAFLDRVGRLIDGLCCVTSVDTYHDVIDALEDAV